MFVTYLQIMDSQWLKHQFETNPNKTKAGLAYALNLTPPAISKILSGTRQIKAHEYNLMRKFFGLPVDGEGATSTKNTYRLETLAGQPAKKHDHSFSDHDHQDGSWVIPASILSQRTKAPPEEIRIFQIQETLMEPDYKLGEHVLVDISDQKPSPPGVFIVSDGFGYMLRSCAFAPKMHPPQIWISANKDSFQTQTLAHDELDIVGRVIAKLQWL